MNDSLDGAVERLRAALEPAGWAVTVEPGVRGAINVEVVHEFSTSMTLVVGSSEDAEARVDRFLASPEIAAIAGMPSDLPHRDLVAMLRVGSAGSGGGRAATSVLVSVARILEKHGLLTTSESIWLEESGIPWMQDRPEEE